MTNKEQLEKMSADKRADCENFYRSHPLTKYIDWNAFLNSGDGNEMHFLKALETFRDENGKTNIVLEKYSEDGIDYRTVYVPEDGEILEIPE